MPDQQQQYQQQQQQFEQQKQQFQQQQFQQESSDVRIARLEERFNSLQEDIQRILATVEELKQQSQWVRGGVVILAGLGGIITFAFEVWDKLKGH
jgi:septal ring factor EnvC (AmiA/AmiB activator)